MSFVRIDGIISENLPMEAYRSESWWSNNPNVHARGWLDAGWEVKEVNLKEAYVVFHKVREMRALSSSRRKKTGELKPFTPVPVHVPRRRLPSKTKVSKLYARIKNIERQRQTVTTRRGTFRPRPRHEKTLFKEKREQ